MGDVKLKAPALENYYVKRVQHYSIVRTKNGWLGRLELSVLSSVVKEIEASITGHDPFAQFVTRLVALGITQCLGKFSEYEARK